jgi:hypothetical protein
LWQAISLFKQATLKGPSYAQSFVDLPHYQLATGETIAAMRSMFEAGFRFV